MSTHAPQRAAMDVAVLTAGSLAAAFAGFLVLAAAGHRLGPDGYAQFAVLWGAFYAVAGFLSGLQQETSRSVSIGRSSHSPDRGVPPIVGSLILGVLSAAIFGIVAPRLGALATNDIEPMAWFVLSMGVVPLALYVSLCGSLAGLGHWRSLAGLVTAEGVIRLPLVPLLLTQGAKSVEHAALTVAGPCIALLALITSQTRAVAAVRGVTNFRGHLSRSCLAGITTGCSGLLISGFPVLFLIASGGPLTAEVGVIFAAITLTRAPILVPLNGLRLRLITWLTSHPVLDSSRDVARLVGLSIGASLVFGVCCAALGPVILQIAFGSAFHMSSLVLGGLGVSAVLTGLLTITGIVLVAADEHPGASAGWVTALLATTAAFALPLPTESLSVMALSVGPTVGVAVHFVWHKSLQGVNR